jgi:nicotinamidase-related amidase
MKTRPFLLLSLAALALGAAAPAKTGSFNLYLRQRAETSKGDNQWHETAQVKNIKGTETAIIICDLWDKHWCQGANNRVGPIADKMAPIIENARKNGVLIIHAPSSCMKFYQDMPQRKMMMEAPNVDAPPTITSWCRLDLKKESALPIDDSDGGCDDQPQCKNHQAWTRQHAAIRIAPEDGISDSGKEIYNVFRQRGIKNILYMGVHANMCVLGRPFGIRQMSQLGFNCVLIRDLTDAMYNPRKSPMVSHAEGTELIVKHVEKYWCPTALSKDLR